MANLPLGNRDLIRAINRSTILNTIKMSGAISRVEIARKTGLSAATVTGITAELIKDGLIYEKAEGDSRGGRRPILLAINPQGGYVVGVKLMEKQVVGAITNLEATIIAKHSEEHQDKTPEAAVDTLAGVANTLVQKIQISRHQLLGVGVGLAGIINARDGILRYSPYFGWRDVPVAEWLQSHLQIPVYIDNDVNTLTLNEQLFGSGQGIDNFLTVTVGRGIGLGIVVNGQLYRGGFGGGGEFGHTTVDSDGPVCSCGNQGCLETYTSDPALLQLAAQATRHGELPEDIETMDDLIACAEGGNATAQAIFARSGEILGRGIANLINIFNPQEVILSGEGIRIGKFLFDPMHAAIKKSVMPGLADDTVIRIDEWEDDAWARGAASLVLQELFKSPIQKSVKEYK
jgi:predicted NBD/HSP70 family sugar kinase